MTLSTPLENISFQQKLFGELEPKENVYAILDGASIPDIVTTLAGFNAESICLYRGELDPELAQTVPYLVQLQPKTELTDWVLGGIGNH